MANYQETTDLASAWKRCNRVIVDNPLDATPSVRFYEENVVSMPIAKVRADAGTVTAQFNPDEQIMLRDPQTGELTGAYVTQAHLYQAIYSLYMQLALRRDLEIAAQQPTPAPAPAA